jgi:hypothetical protein
MYSLWLVVNGKRYALKRRYDYIAACRLATQAADNLARVHRAEVTDIRDGKVVFTVESVKSY